MAGEEDYAPIELGKNKVVRVTKFKVKINNFSHSSCNKEMIKNGFLKMNFRNFKKKIIRHFYFFKNLITKD